MNAPLPPGAAAVAQLPMDAIGPSPSNPRKHFDDVYIAELAGTIQSHGILQPITVRPNPRGLKPLYEIVVGECRWRAGKLAGLNQIPAFWRELDDKQVLEIQVIENLQRRDVHPVEEAEGYDQLMKVHGYRAEEIAGKIGKSRGYVYARLKLIALCPAAREAFYAGKLEASTALLIARISGVALQKKALDQIIHGHNGEVMSYRNAKYHIHNNFTISLKQATFSLPDATLLPSAGSCADCPKRSGNAPEICADIEDVDVCTDTTCFDDKRQARRDRLIANAEQRNIPFLSGAGALEAINTNQYIDLDDVVEGDGQARSYRDILGDKAPVNALLEIGFGERNKHLFETAYPMALAKALKKAGWTPDLFKDGEQATDSSQAQRRAERAIDNDENDEREKRQQAVKAEVDYRLDLSTAVIDRVRTMTDAGELNTDKLMVLLASAWLRFDFTFNEELDIDCLKRFGITVPTEPPTKQDEYDDSEELEKVVAIMLQWPVGTATAFLFDRMTSEETNTKIWNFDPATDLPHILLSLAKIVDFDPENLRPKSNSAAEDPADPAPAAQASAKAPKKPAAKKTKTKADPAPASPANEPAAPVKAEPAQPDQPWPFPTRGAAA